MGFKLNENVNVVPFSVTDGVVSIYVGEEDILQFSVPSLKGYDVPKYVRQFQCPNLMAYATTEEYGIALRFDGTGCVFTRDKFLIKSFTFDYKPVEVKGPYAGGVFRFVVGSNTNKLLAELWSIKLEDKKLYLLQASRPWTLILNASKNKDYFSISGLGTLEGYPPMQIVPGDGMYLVDYDLKPYLKLDGDLYESDGFAML